MATRRRGRVGTAIGVGVWAVVELGVGVASPAGPTDNTTFDNDGRLPQTVFCA